VRVRGWQPLCDAPRWAVIGGCDFCRGTRPRLTAIHLCHACSCLEIEDPNYSHRHGGPVRQGLPGHHGCFAVMHTGAPLPRNPRMHRARPRCAHARLCTAVLTGICLRSVCSCHAILSPPTSVDNVWRRCDPNRNHAVARTGFYFHGSDDEAIYAMFGPNQVNAATDTTERTLIVHHY
jgi:hypothetical protein